MQTKSKSCAKCHARIDAPELADWESELCFGCSDAKTALDPRIGTLIRNGQTIFYYYVPLSNGDKRIVSGEFIYVEGDDPEEIAAYLPR